MDLGLGKDKQEELGEEQGKEIKKVGKSVWNGIDAAGNQYSEDCKDGMDWLGQKLGIDYDKPNENGETMRQIREKEKQELSEEQNQLEEESPYNGIFNEVKNDFYKALNIASLAMAARDLPALAKAGFGKAKDFNMALKSFGIDGKFIDQGLDFIENSSKKVTGKLSKGTEDFREAIMKLFGNGGSKAELEVNPFDENGNLKPNIKYKTGEYDYLYETDDMGRISKFETDDLQLADRDERLPHNPNTPGKLDGDHAGHLAGDRFGGSPDLDNLVSQSSNVNLSQYKKIENQWAKAIKAEKNVEVKVEVKYDGDSLRPSEFNVKYTIDGKPFSRNILN